MNFITIPSTARAIDLYNLCKSNGVTFVGFRTKQAKRLYIAAIELHNAAVLALRPVVEKVIEKTIEVVTPVVIGAVAVMFSLAIVAVYVAAVFVKANWFNAAVSVGIVYVTMRRGENPMVAYDRLRSLWSEG
jgi:hypothetical protein